MKKIIFLLFKKMARYLSGHRLGSIPLIRIVADFLLIHFRDTNKPVVIGNNKMFLDHGDSLRLSIHPHEPVETEFIREEVNKGDVVLDIGAHIGYYTLIFAELVGGQGKIFAFEPHPDNFALLKKNVEINGYQNVILINKAVSNKNRKIKLYLDSKSSGDHRVHSSNKNMKFIEVESVCMDDYFSNYQGKIDFIKMDIEGAEPKAIEGMSSLFSRNRKIKMLIEFFPLRLKESGVEPKNYLELLKGHNFEIYLINTKKRKLEPLTIGQLLNQPFSMAGNLFCARGGQSPKSKKAHKYWPI